MVGGRDGAVGFLGHGLVGRVKVHFAVNAGAVEPKRHVDALDLVDVVAGDKALGQQDLALVVFLECGRDVMPQYGQGVTATVPSDTSSAPHDEQM